MFVDPTSQTCFRTWEYSDIKVAQFLPFHLISPAMPGRRWEDLYRTLAPEICHGSFITAKSMFHPCFQLMFFMLELSLLAKKKKNKNQLSHTDCQSWAWVTLLVAQIHRGVIGFLIESNKSRVGHAYNLKTDLSWNNQTVPSSCRQKILVHEVHDADWIWNIWNWKNRCHWPQISMASIDNQWHFFWSLRVDFNDLSRLWALHSWSRRAKSPWTYRSWGWDGWRWRWVWGFVENLSSSLSFSIVLRILPIKNWG